MLLHQAIFLLAPQTPVGSDPWFGGLMFSDTVPMYFYTMFLACACKGLTNREAFRGDYS